MLKLRIDRYISDNLDVLRWILAGLRRPDAKRSPITIGTGSHACIEIELLISARPQRQTNAEGCRIFGDLDQLKSKATTQKTVD